MYIKKYDEILTLEDKVDKDGLLYYSFYLKPPVWAPGIELIEGDIVSPSIPTGYYYVVTSSGISGLGEPSWSTTKNSITTDNTVTYKAVNNTAYLRSTDSINIATSLFETSESVPIVAFSVSSEGRGDVKVGPVPEGVSSFILTFKFWVNTGYSEEEYDEQSIKIKVKEN